MGVLMWPLINDQLDTQLPAQAVAKEFRGRLKADDLDELWAAFSRLQFGWASTELQVGRGRNRWNVAHLAAAHPA